MSLPAKARSARGYASVAYAQALGQDGIVRALRHSGGHLVLRRVGKTHHRDASGCYPLFSCPRPERLPDDLAELPDDIVAVSLVPDPLLGPGLNRLQRTFRVVRPLGEHYLVRLASSPHCFSSHHRRKLRQAARQPVDIRIEPDATGFLEDWVRLYGTLIRKAGITGLRCFSADIFADMLRVPGTILFSSWDGSDLLGADWYLQDGDRVYAHLSAYSQQGYARSVSYPMMEAAIRYFSGRARILDLGGVPTVAATASGVAHFKKGWATHTCPAYFCGLDLDTRAYAKLSGGRPPSAGGFFPYYRRGEFS